MGRPPRDDYPGAWHHITNRGVARRAIFESGRDVAEFLELLDGVTRRGTLEVHAYALMTNHFHLLARSPAGDISDAMWRVGQGYVRYFNRGRQRDGPLHKSRFWSRGIESGPYWQAVLRYIDRNPVTAGLASRSVDYPYGSAHWYAKGGGPHCLRMDVVADFLGLGVRDVDGKARSYPVEIAATGPSFVDEFVEGRMWSGASGSDPLCTLVGASRDHVKDWVRQAARAADGLHPTPVLVPPSAVLAAIGGPGGDPKFLATMLHFWAGLTLEEAAVRAGISPSTCQRSARAHRARINEDDAYREKSASVLMEALRQAFPLARDLPR